MDNGMDFKELEKNKFAEIKTENKMKEQPDNQYQMMEPEQKLEQQEELPAEKLLKERKTMPVIRGAVPEEMETSELDQIKARASWRETSMIAEQRKAALNSGKMMLRMKEQYFGEYKEAQKQREQEMKERKVEQEVKPRTLEQIRNAIWENQMLDDLFDTTYQLREDTETASESFTAMVTTADEMIRMFKKSENVSTSDYQSAFASAWKAVNHYLDTHKSNRWTDKGERRKNLATQLKAQLEAVREPIFDLLLEAKKAEMSSYEDNISCQNKKGEISSYISNNMSKEYTEKQIKELAKNGTMNEKLKAMMDMSVTDYYQSVYQDELKSAGFKFNEKQFQGNYQTLQDSIVNLSPFEQLEAVDSLVGMQTILTEKIMEEYDRHFNEAPDETDPEAYAILKLQNSPLCVQQKALDSFATSLAMESKSEAITEAVMNFRKLRVVNMPDPEQVQDIMKKMMETQPEEYILKVGSDLYRKIAEETDANELNILLKSNLVSKQKTKDKKQQVNTKDLFKQKYDTVVAEAVQKIPEELRKKNENRIFEALKDIPINMSDESMQKRKDAFSAYFNSDLYGTAANVFTEKGMSEMFPDNSVEGMKNKINYVAFFMPVRDQMLPQYAEKLDKLINSFTRLSADEKLQMAEMLFSKRILAMNNLLERARKTPANVTSMQIAPIICGSKFMEKLKETVPDVVELAERYIETYLREHKECQEVVEKELKEYSMDYQTALKKARILQDGRTILKGGPDETELQRLKDAVTESEGSMKTQVLAPIHKLIKQGVSLQLVKREDVMNMSREQIVECSKLKVAMKEEMKKLGNLSGELGSKIYKESLPEDSKEAMEKSDIDMYQSSMEGQCKDFVSYIEQLLFLDAEQCESRIPQDEAYQRKLMEEKEYILSRDKEDFSEEEIKKLQEESHPAEVLNVVFKLCRLMERGTRFYSGRNESAKITMKSREHLFKNDMIHHISDLIEDSMLNMNQEDFYELLALIGKMEEEIEAKAMAEYEKYLKSAPEGIDAQLYATLKMFYSPVGQDYEAMYFMSETFAYCANMGIAQAGAPGNKIYGVDHKVTGQDINTLERACRKLPQELVQSLMKENKWEEQREEFNQKHGKYLLKPEAV